MLMERNEGVRQHHGENALDGGNWNPLGLQKWPQIFDGVISTPREQMVLQHRDLCPWGLDGTGRRGGQALGIP